MNYIVVQNKFSELIMIESLCTYICRNKFIVAFIAKNNIHFYVRISRPLFTSCIHQCNVATYVGLSGMHQCWQDLSLFQNSTQETISSYPQEHQPIPVDKSHNITFTRNNDLI